VERYEVLGKPATWRAVSGGMSVRTASTSRSPSISASRKSTSRASVRRIEQLRPAVHPSPRLRASGSTGSQTPLGGAAASQVVIRRSAHVADGPSTGSQYVSTYDLVGSTPQLAGSQTTAGMSSRSAIHPSELGRRSSGASGHRATTVDRSVTTRAVTTPPARRSLWILGG
jgi:hypothetical protein